MGYFFCFDSIPPEAPNEPETGNTLRVICDEHSNARKQPQTIIYHPNAMHNRDLMTILSCYFPSDQDEQVQAKVPQPTLLTIVEDQDSKLSGYTNISLAASA